MRLISSTVAIVILTGLVLLQPDVAAQRQPPPPESVLGFAPCADYQLATYEQIADYLRQLDAASDRMQLVDIGRTAESRTQLMAVISSEANMKNLTRFKTIAQQLARARGLTDEEARALAQEGKAVVWIDFGLHSTEVGHAQTAPLMAYRAVTGESDEWQTIRDNVIFLLLPNMNPDGTTLVARWYMKHVGTPFEQSSPPELYQKYVGHDNNRDWFMFNQPETRNVGRQVYHEWFPQIIHNQHQSAPFPARIFVPPFEDPMNPNIPPLVMRGVNAVGEAMTRRLEQEGKRGAISRLNFDTWWNGGMRTAPYYHNMIGILTETAHASATPATYDPKTFPRTFANGEPTLEPSTYYPSPYLGGQWHLRDTCEYMATASMAVLNIGATRKTEWLYDIYQMGRDAIRAGAGETYIIPPDQWDPGTAARLVNVLRWGAIEVERATAPVTVENATYPPGSYIIHGAQPFRAHLTDLLNPQVYPDRRLYPGGPPERPYDITGWTLPFQMGVRVEKHDQGLSARAGDALEPVKWAPPPEGQVTGVAPQAYVLDPRANDSFTAVNRLLAAGETVSRTTARLTVGDTTWPAGAFLVSPGPQTRMRLEQVATTLGLSVAALDDTLPTDLRRLRAPRVGLYHGWGGNMDEGWTRWILEQFEFPYTSVFDKDVRAGNLRAMYDVIVLPDASYERMLTGLAPGTMPSEYTGGMTLSGLANLYAFVQAGGTLVTLDTASSLPLTTFSLPIRDVTQGQRESDFYIPGTLLRLSMDVDHPVAYGMPSEVAGFFAESPAFAVTREGRPAGAARGADPAVPPGVRIIARYPEEELLMSGWLLGERIIAGRAAVVEAAIEDGRVVLLGFRTQHRGQTHATFKLLFNSIYLGGMAKQIQTNSPNPARRLGRQPGSRPRAAVRDRK